MPSMLYIEHSASSFFNTPRALILALLVNLSRESGSFRKIYRARTGLKIFASHMLALRYFQKFLRALRARLERALLQPEQRWEEGDRTSEEVGEVGHSFSAAVLIFYPYLYSCFDFYLLPLFRVLLRMSEKYRSPTSTLGKVLQIRLRPHFN